MNLKILQDRDKNFERKCVITNSDICSKVVSCSLVILWSSDFIIDIPSHFNNIHAITDFTFHDHEKSM